VAGKVTRSILDRFWEKVMPEPNSGCWLWIGALSQNGYGSFSKLAIVYAAHRVSYELFRGNIPEGLHLDHLCRVRCCVNPDHLEPVTRAVNTRRGATVFDNYKRKITHCKRGHQLSGDGANVQVKNSGGSYRRACRICSNEMQRLRRNRKITENQHG